MCCGLSVATRTATAQQRPGPSSARAMRRLGAVVQQVVEMTTLPEAAPAPAAATAGFQPLKGKNALVTGGSRGVGESCCVRLAELGCNVAINYARTAERAEGVKAQCEALGVKAVCVQADVSRDAECKRLVEESVAGLGGLDILVNVSAAPERPPPAPPTHPIAPRTHPTDSALGTECRLYQVHRLR